MGDTAPPPLAGLYNGAPRGGGLGPPDATKRALVGTGDRPQEIYTPPEIRDALLRLWPYIEFDPCWGPASIIPARSAAYVAPEHIPTKNGKGTKTVFRVKTGEIDGLAVAWPDYTYANPPFNLLKLWMEKAARENVESVLLVPVRPHRKWWRATAATSRRICWLDPVRFNGFASSFPAPLACPYWGNMPHAFEAAFSPLGDVRIF